MANTQNYINHLLQNTGITPACSEEERLAAEDIAQIFRNHGFDPEVQEFNAPAPSRLAFAVTGILAFAGALLMGIGGGIGLVGTLLSIVGAVLYVLERTGHPLVSRLGKTGVSQNVIAYHKASGPLASPRNRPVVVVAHYDSPRAELLAREPYAPYRALVAKLLPVATIAPAAVAILRILPLPGVLKVLLWVVAILASLVALANAANIISNRFVLPYTSGAVCNKSSVAAMLGVMDNVAPYQGENEFPDDIPFDTYFGEQKRRAEEMARAAAEYAAAQQQNDYGNTIEYEEPSYDEDEFGQPVAPVDVPEQHEAFDGQIDGFEGASADETLIGVIAPEAQDQTAQAEVSTEEQSAAEPAEEPAAVEAAEPESKLYRNAAGNIRFGSDAIRALGMLPESCTLDYEEGEEPTFEPEPAPVAQEPAPAANTAVAPAEPVAAPVAAAESDEKPPLDSAAGLDILAPAAPAQVEDETADEDYDEYPQRVSYESDTDFSAELPSTTPHADIASAFSSIGASASSFFKGALAKGKKFVDDFEEKRAAAREAAEREAIAQQQAAEAERERAAQEFEQSENEQSENEQSENEQSENEQPKPVDVADATTSFEAPQPTSADVAEATTSFEAQQPVDGTMSFDATMTFEKQGTAIAEPLPISDDAQDAADDSVVDEADSVEAGAPEQVEAPAMEQESPAIGEAPKTDESRPYSTQIFTMPAPSDPGATVANVAPTQDETVDSLMAQISSQVPPRQQMNIPDPASAPAPSSSPLASVPDPSLPSMQQANVASRTSLFDLPDPAAQINDPFATAQGPEPTSAPVAAPMPISSGAQPLETISAPASTGAKPQKRGLGGLFGRKKKNEQDSMSDWLGVEDDYDAKKSGRGIGSWDNFEDDDDGWKGGATSSDGASAEDMLSAVASMGDDELLGHDIWFVATGASDCDGAGMRAFLASHRDKLRGVFFINLESIGAGRLSVVTVEGEQQLFKGDRRIMNLVSKVCKSFHVDCGAFEMPYAKTDASAALEASRRALTIAGVDGPRLACARTDDDLPYNVNPTNIATVSEVVTEVIRRS